ncbi:disease resistance protein (TIR-NBS-LRR class) [Trifolium pratense]|uniref:Disease resistance protein (TIR-NBS-LRR class) n=1 Tax=Trifolium pratense TaxID=57577 RepID=A0A2K3K672_TRIPR|nr:disease resistance protein (TIR-NBS-LRR class) [Trifolium pratense]
MPNVEDVRLKGISNLSLFLPMAIMRFANMKELDLSRSNIRVLPECLKECTPLLHLILDYCHSLEDISAIPPNLQRLSAIDCKSLNSLFLPMAIMQFANMQFLNLSGSNIRVLPECLKK